nr:hypothetical protein [Tanacetum cinerariifolium]
MEEEDSKARKRISETHKEKAAKKQKLDEEVAELKRHLQIVPNDEDDIYIEATLLARKVPVVAETDTQEMDKNKAKNDKTKSKVEKIGKDKVNRSWKSKVKARGQQKSTPGKSKSTPTKPKAKWKRSGKTKSIEAGSQKSKPVELRPKGARFLIASRFPTPPLASWERFNDLLRECPHHGFFELHQLDTFYNALNVNDQDSLNSAAGGNFLDKMPRECLKIIESKSKVRQSWAKVVVAKVSTSSSTPAISSDVAKLKDMVKALLLDKKNQSSDPTPSSTYAPVKSVEPNCVTCGGAHSYQNCPATNENAYRDNIQESGTLSGNTVTNPKEELKGITTRSGVAYQGLKTPSPSKQGTKVTKDQVQTPNSQNTAHVQPLVIQSESQSPVFEPVVAPVSALMPNLKPSIPYPSRHDNEKCRDQANEQIKKFYEIFKEMSFEISFTDALILMLKFASTLKALIENKEKLSEMARTSMNEHCSAVIQNKLPRKLGDPDKFLIPSLSLPKLTPTCMTLELADHSISKPIGIAKDVSFKVGVFHFPADFVVVNFEPNPRVPLILERCFLKTSQALIDVHKGELTLRIKNEAITYNLDQTEVLGFSDTTTSGNLTPHDDLIISTMSPTLTLFGDIDFLIFEEADAFLGLEDDPNSPKINPFYYDPKEDILLLETILNSEQLPPLPNHEQYLPSFKKELKVCEAKTIKSSVDEPPEVELKDLPHHLEYAFLEGDNKLLFIIAKELGDEEKSALIKVLKSHKRAITWKLSDI